MILLVLLLFAKIFKSQLFTFGLFYFVSFKVGGDRLSSSDSDEDVLASIKDQDVLTSIEDKDVLASVKDKDVDNNEVKK